MLKLLWVQNGSDTGTGAKRARYFKQDKKEVAAMCKIMEDMRNEAVKKTTKDNARRLLKLGKKTHW